MQPKRTHTDDDAGDAHEMLTEVQNWDLRDHRQQATHVKNRRNVHKGRSTMAPGTPTGTAPSSLNCGCVGFLMICQDSRFRSGPLSGF